MKYYRPAGGRSDSGVYNGYIANPHSFFAERPIAENSEIQLMPARALRLVILKMKKSLQNSIIYSIMEIYCRKYKQIAAKAARKRTKG